MNRIDRLLRKVEKARSETLAKEATRISTKYKHYKTTKTKAEREIQNIERINRNAPVTRTKINPIEEWFINEVKA